MIKKIFSILCFVSLICTGYPQLQRDSFLNRTLEERISSSQKDPVAVDVQLGPMHPSSVSLINKKRLWLVAGSSALLYVGSFVALNQAWYAGYQRSPFHFFNDNKEWQQVDKIGHIWTSYQISRVSTEAWRWTGLSDRKAVLLGGISGVAYQSVIEIQDGYSSEWGFSWADMAANVLGSAVFVIQESSWKEQRLHIKFSYWPYNYGEELLDRRNQLFGNRFIERILKDYNAQTYWVSGNLHSFFPETKLPRWLNIAIGYKGNGMLGGKENVWKDKLGNRIERYDVPRVRRFYISPDIDFTKIRTNSRALKSIFFLLNAVKIPAPAIEANSKGKLKAYALYF